MKIWNTAKVPNIPSNIAKIWAGNWQYWSNFCALPALGVWFIFSYMVFIFIARSSSDMKLFYKRFQVKNFGKHHHTHLRQGRKNFPKVWGTRQNPRRQFRVTRRNLHTEDPPPHTRIRSRNTNFSRQGFALPCIQVTSHSGPHICVCAARSQINTNENPNTPYADCY
jgi:hypothetical protein